MPQFKTHYEFDHVYFASETDFVNIHVILGVQDEKMSCTLSTDSTLSVSDLESVLTSINISNFSKLRLDIHDDYDIFYVFGGIKKSVILEKSSNIKIAKLI